jgi:ABC-type microcin C transport system duplicated ATPase subunit YejF
LLEPTEEKILVNGEDITDLDAEQMLLYRRRMQMIYQDPYALLNPRMSAGEIVGEH